MDHRGREPLDAARLGLFIAGALVVILGGAALVAAGSQSHLDEQAVWFTAIAAAVALVGLLAAGAAVYFAIPGYRDLRKQQRARPLPKVRFQFPDEHTGRWSDAAPDMPVARSTLKFSARVIVENLGDAVLQWGILNIQAPTVCSIESAEGDSSGHHRSPTPFASQELYPGKICDCNATVVERDFPPTHSFIYNVNVTAPAPGRWPLAAVLDGYPAVRGWTRIEVLVGEETRADSSADNA